MRFSIRALLAFTLLVVLAMLAWRAARDARRAEARISQMNAEVASLEASLQLDDPAVHAAILNTHDQFHPLAEMRRRSMERFALLREKYGAIRPPGAGVVAIRRIPSLHRGAGAHSVEFRIWVPEERSVWLKFGVRTRKPSDLSSQIPEEDELLGTSPFNASGPFERRLPAGSHTLEIATGPVREGALPVTITLDGMVILRSRYISSDVTSAGSMHPSARSQINFGPREDLPQLLVAKMNLRDPPSGAPRPVEHVFMLWLSGETSSFARFPGESP